MKAKRAASFRHVLIVFALAIVALLGSVHLAFATDITTNDLETKLDANGGTLDAYMKTVLKGSTVETIDLQIVGVTAGFQGSPDGMDSLILFRSDDAKLKKCGGIAEGMSGSPIYLKDTDELVGALSYGDSFTLDNFGLATPIAAMRDVAALPTVLASKVKLANPVKADDGVTKTNVIITDDPADHKKEAEGSSIVVSPMKAMFLSGIRFNTAYGKTLSSYLSKKGVALHATSGPVGPGSSYEAPYETGGALSVLYSKGSLQMGGVGTVTEADGNDVLAFGHPMEYTGNSSLFLANAWIDGVWPSSASPYKMARIATSHGTLTQDRSAGIFGVDGVSPDSMTVTSSVTNLDTGKTGTASTQIPQFVLTDWKDFGWYFIPENAAYVAAGKVFDSYYISGTAKTIVTATIKWGPGADQTKKVIVNNLYQDDYDVVAQSVSSDISNICNQVSSVYDTGTYKPQVVALDYKAEVESAKKFGEVVDVSVPSKGLVVGTNVITLRVARPGVAQLETVKANLSIPKGRPLNGLLTVEGVGDSGSFDEGDLENAADESAAFHMDRRSVSTLLSDLQNTTPNTVFQIAYDTERGTDTAQATVPYVAYGSVMKFAPTARISLRSSTIAYNGTAKVSGYFEGSGTGKLSLYSLAPGATAYKYIKTLGVNAEEGTFAATIAGLKANTKYKVVYTGSDSELACTSNVVNQKVQAKASLKASATRVKLGKKITLSAAVTPATTKGKLVFQRWNGKAWVAYSTKTSVSGKASVTYSTKTQGTVKFRVRYEPTAGATNVASPWASASVKYVK